MREIAALDSDKEAAEKAREHPVSCVEDSVVGVPVEAASHSAESHSREYSTRLVSDCVRGDADAGEGASGEEEDESEERGEASASVPLLCAGG